MGSYYRSRDNNNQNSSRPPLIKDCFNCGAKIRLMPDPTGRTKEDGKPRYVPFEANDLAQRHRCLSGGAQQASEYKSKPNKEKSEGIRCRICNDGTMIMFSDDQKSKSGKFIPLELSGEPHQHREKEQEDIPRPYGTARQLDPREAEQEGFNE